MRAGRLNRRIELYVREPKRDTQSGEDVGEWRPLRKDPRPCAMVENAGGGESFGAEQRVATATLAFTIWWRADVASGGVTMRVLYEGHSYDITSVDEIGNREALKLTGTARAE